MAEENKSTSFFNSPLVTSLLALCGLGGAGYLVMPKSTETPNNPSVEAPARENKDKGETVDAPAYDPLRILETYFAKSTAKDKDEDALKYTAVLRNNQPGGLIGTVFEKEKKETSANVDLELLDSDLEDYDLELAIACLPDPLKTKFAHEFDWTVDAIQRAFETREMTLRHYDLPWQMAENKVSDSKKLSKLLDTPGVLLFSKSRKVPENQKCLERKKMALVFLVGESPIEGIRQLQFLKAVEACRRLGDFYTQRRLIAKNSNPSKRHHNFANCNLPPAISYLTIIGPYYSGSQSSFAKLLNTSLVDKNNFIYHDLNFFSIKVFNGGASELKFNTFAEYPGLKNNHLIPESFVVPNPMLQLSISNFINGNRSSSLKLYNNGPIITPNLRTIILSESNTGFGTMSKDSLSKDLKNSLPKDLNYSLPKTISSKISYFGYPISISQLSSKHVSEVKNNITLPFLDFVEPKLNSKLSAKSDTIAPFDLQSNTSAAGQWLRMIIQIIQTENVKYVGVLATDTRDVVFLNRVLKKECHNIQLFTSEPNIAVQHPEDSKDLRGLLVASSYPNYALPEPRQPRQPRIFFPAPSGYGYFNAILAGKGNDANLIWCDASRSLPLERVTRNVGAWISMVGTGGKLVPLHYYIIDPKTQDTFNPNDKYVSLYKSTLIDHTNETPLVSFTSTFTLEIFIVYIIILYVTYKIYLKYKMINKSGQFVAVNENEITPETIFWSIVCLLGLLLAVGAFSIPGLSLSSQINGEPSTWTHTLSFLLPLFLTIISTAISVPYLHYYKIRKLFSGDLSENYLDRNIIFRFSMSYLINLILLSIIYFFADRNTPLTILIYLTLWISETIKICYFLNFYSKILKSKSFYATFFMVLFFIMYYIFSLFPFFLIPPLNYLSFADFCKFFILLRINDQSSGLSPLAPMLLLGLSAFILGLSTLRSVFSQFNYCASGRIKIEALNPNNVVFAKQLRHFANLTSGSLGTRIKARSYLLTRPASFASLLSRVLTLNKLFLKKRIFISFILCAFITSLLYELFFIKLPTSESICWDVIVTLSSAGILISITVAIIRIANIWDILKSTMDALKNSHFRDCFKNTPKEIKSVFGNYFGPIDNKASDINILINSLEASKKLEFFTGLKCDLKLAKQIEHGDSLFYFQDNNESFLASIFIRNKLNGIFNDELKAASMIANSTAIITQKPYSQFTLSDFSISYFVLFFTGLIIQLRRSIFAAMGSIALAFLAFASFPFQPEGLFIHLIVFQMICLVALTCIILYVLNVHPIPSNITGSTPDQVSFDWKFVNNLLQFVAPLVLLLALHFLGFLRFIIEPVLGLLR